jgi:diguanylate cyclase (GGDEF)-like protein
MEKQLEDAAITDSLTGIFNRRGFFIMAEQQCKLSDRNKRALSLLYIDLDGMKNINDELGHKEGDLALIDTSRILKRSLRETDIVARIGGDEFTVLLTDTSEPDIEKVIIGHIHNNIAKHNETAGRRYELMLSIGISRYDPAFPCAIDDLMHRADKLMYEDKTMHRLQREIAFIKETKSDRRIYKRFITSHDCWAELDISGKVKIHDISINGARVSTPRPLGTDIIYKIKISPGNREEMSLAGIVAWSSPSEAAEGNAASVSYMAGIKFIQMSNTLKSSIDQFIEGYPGD